MIRHVWTQDRGGAAVELAIVLPVLMLMVLGVVDFGRLFYAYVTVASAAHQAATYAARYTAGTAEPEAVEQVVYGEADSFLNDTNTEIVGPTFVVDGSVTLAQVRVTHSFRPLAALPVRGPVTISLTAVAPVSGG
jgi:Flp pilus assembly protein TadG